MAWIESHQELGRHPKTRKLAKLLGISRPAVVGHLHYLWWWCLDYAPDGDLAHYDDDEVAAGAEWDGAASPFVAALVAVGFVDADRLIHDWHDYGGKLLAQRQANAARQQRWRDRHRDDGPVTRNENVTVTSPSRNALEDRTGQDRTREDTPPLTPPLGGDAPAAQEDEGRPARAPAPAARRRSSQISPETLAWVKARNRANHEPEA